MAKYTAVLFDLDGTLLPMDMDTFTKAYFKLLAKKLAPLGYEAGALIDAIWAGTAAMVKNDGSVINEEAFWKKFTQLMGEKTLDDKPVFEDYYANEFDGARAATGFNPLAAEAVKRIKQAGMRVALATNPIFPDIATRKRTQWAGLDVNDFEAYTTYENSSFSKPNPDYYLDLLKKLNLEPSETLMVGNDVREDILAGTKAGMDTFLITDCMLNKDNADISQVKQGGFKELMEYLGV